MSSVEYRSQHWLEAAMATVSAVVALIAGALPWPSHAQAKAEQVLNLYSARHYQTDEALYDNFTRQTGIKINRIELGDESLLQRVKSEGANSPADVVLLVDAARLWRAQIEGLFQPIKSTVLDERIPPTCVPTMAAGSVSRPALA
jgi:iron(III) transport system substrate-binding protein